MRKIAAIALCMSAMTAFAQDEMKFEVTAVKEGLFGTVTNSALANVSTHAADTAPDGKIVYGKTTTTSYLAKATKDANTSITTLEAGSAWEGTRIYMAADGTCTKVTHSDFKIVPAGDVERAEFKEENISVQCPS